MLISKLIQDERGFVISAELVLVSTLLVTGIVVGLSEVQASLNSELNDVADSVGSFNQGYVTSGYAKKSMSVVIAQSFGSQFLDVLDVCDDNQNELVGDIGVVKTRVASRRL